MHSRSEASHLDALAIHLVMVVGLGPVQTGVPLLVDEQVGKIYLHAHIARSAGAQSVRRAHVRRAFSNSMLMGLMNVLVTYSAASLPDA
jgi:predicted FMN-binding regulatory protein PaiB